MAALKIEFVDAPPPRTGSIAGTLHDDIAEALKARPGKWAKVIKGAKSAGAASTINTAGASAYAPRGSFEATSRQSSKGQYDIYARFIGNAPAASKAADA